MLLDKHQDSLENALDTVHNESGLGFPTSLGHHYLRLFTPPSRGLGLAVAISTEGLALGCARNVCDTATVSGSRFGILAATTGLGRLRFSHPHACLCEEPCCLTKTAA